MRIVSFCLHLNTILFTLPVRSFSSPNESLFSSWSFRRPLETETEAAHLSVSFPRGQLQYELLRNASTTSGAHKNSASDSTEQNVRRIHGTDFTVALVLHGMGGTRKQSWAVTTPIVTAGVNHMPIRIRPSVLELYSLMTDSGDGMGQRHVHLEINFSVALPYRFATELTLPSQSTHIP